MWWAWELGQERHRKPYRIIEAEFINPGVLLLGTCCLSIGWQVADSRIKMSAIVRQALYHLFRVHVVPIDIGVKEGSAPLDSCTVSVGAWGKNRLANKQCEWSKWSKQASLECGQLVWQQNQNCSQHSHRHSSNYALDIVSSGPDSCSNFYRDWCGTAFPMPLSVSSKFAFEWRCHWYILKACRHLLRRNIRHHDAIRAS